MAVTVTVAVVFIVVVVVVSVFDNIVRYWGEEQYCVITYMSRDTTWRHSI